MISAMTIFTWICNRPSYQGCNTRSYEIKIIYTCHIIIKKSNNSKKKKKGKGKKRERERKRNPSFIFNKGLSYPPLTGGIIATSSLS